MIRQVTKAFEFESAHRLSNYDGKCKRIHGHNYRGIVTAESEDLDQVGMVVDFGDLKDAIKKEIIEVFDHRLILLAGDVLNDEIAKVLPEGDIVWTTYNPTAECMAFDFLQRLKKVIPQVVKVELFETPDASATASEF